MKPFVGLVALLAATLASGQLANQGQVTVPGTFAPGTSNIRFQTIGQGSDALTNASGMFLFNEPNGFINYWKANHRGPLPKLEAGFFNNWRLLAIHTGTRPTGGYAIGVLGMQRQIDKALVSAVEFVPPRGSRNAQVTTAPWILLRVENGAFDFNLQTRQIAGYPGGFQTIAGGTTMKIGGVSVTFAPTCDHCSHCGRGTCHCAGGPDCDCKHG